MKLIIDEVCSVNLDQLPKKDGKNPEGLLLIDGSDLPGLFRLPFSVAQPAILINPFFTLSQVQITELLLTEYHLNDYIYWSEDGEKWSTTSIDNLNHNENKSSYLFLPGKSSEASLEKFQEIIAQLRSPEGCPWDKKQTHASLRTYLLEETYEALDALDRGDWDSLKEELGDLLLQIALHAQIGEENSEFRISDVVTNIYQKIVFRHPHVFKDWKVDGEDQVIQNWEALKLKEREGNDETNGKGVLDGVPASYPALAQAQSIQERAARVGFDWKEIAPVLDKVMEELTEIRNAESDVERVNEFGDLLFALVNFMRWNKIDAETALRQTNNKFRKRFAFLESSAREQGRLLNQMTLEEMDVLWEKAKQFDD